MKGRIVILVPDQGPPQMRAEGLDMPTALLTLAQMWVSVVQQSIPPPAPPVAVPTPEETAELQKQQKVLAG